VSELPDVNIAKGNGYEGDLKLFLLGSKSRKYCEDIVNALHICSASCEFHCTRCSYRICVNDYAVSGHHDVIVLNKWEERVEIEKVKSMLQEGKLEPRKIGCKWQGAMLNGYQGPSYYVADQYTRIKSITKTSITRSEFFWGLENRRDHIKGREIGKRWVGFIVQKLKMGLFTNSSLILLARLCQVYRDQLPCRPPALCQECPNRIYCLEDIKTKSFT
jgi:hypothetical protein